MSSSTVINELISELDFSRNHLRGDDALTVAVGVNVGALDVFVNSNK